MQDDTRNPSSTRYYGSALLQDMSEMATMRVNRNHTYTWAQNLRFLVFDDTDHDEGECHEAHKGKNKAISSSAESIALGQSVKEDGEIHEEDQDEDLQRAIALSLQNDEQEPTNEESRSADNGNDVEDEDEDEDALLQRAIAMSMQDDEQFLSEDHPTHETTASSVMQTDHQSVDIRNRRSCEACSSLSYFPAADRVTKFRVVGPEYFGTRNFKGCGHYIAVSYCWPKDADNNPVQTETSYSVRSIDSDGSPIVRPNRAPDAVIDRAVAFARNEGIRMIWIDQECLPQDSSEEQEIGIQAMDMVYQRAFCSVGLIDTLELTQENLDAMSLVLYWHMHRHEPSVRLPIAPVKLASNLLELLESLAVDPFHARAWIIQEMLCAGLRAMLLIRKKGKAVFRAIERVTEAPQLVEGIFNILLEDMTRLIAASRAFLQQSRMVDMFGYERIFKTLTSLETFHPPKVDAISLAAKVYAVGGTNYGGRRAFNAAVALTYLRTRFNYRPADRLAIMANLCDYEIRLDTTKVEKRFKSLSVCLLTLSLINGDLSLLCPESYGLAGASNPKEGPTWIPEFYDTILSINSHRLTSGVAISLRNTNRYDITKDSLQLPGYLWAVDRQVDLTPIQWAYKDQWESLNCYQIAFERLPKETEEDFQARVTETKQSMQHRGAYPATLESTGMDVLWEGMSARDQAESLGRNPGVTVTRMIFADKIESSEWAKDLVGRMFLDIMVYLQNSGETTLADSIWHSVRVASVAEQRKGLFDRGGSDQDLPDNVEDLEKIGELLRTPWKLLQLDRTQRGTYHQMWIVDRVMQDGFLWAGNYVKAQLPFKDTPESQNEQDKDASDEVTVAAEAMEVPESSTTDVTNSTEGLLPDARVRKEDSVKKDLFRSRVLDSQITRQLMASMMRTMYDGPKHSTSVNLGAVVQFAYVMHRKLWEPKAEFDRCRRVAAFDVDGPCMIITPFDSDLERLPRSEWRSMSLAWVVEEVERTDLGAAFTDEDIDVGRVKPMHISADSVDVNQAGPSHHVSYEEKNHRVGASEIDQGTAIVEPDPGKSDETEKGIQGTYRIFSRVRGAWEAMDEPAQRFNIV